MKWSDVPLGFAGRLESLARLEPHDLLEVSADASDKEVRNAYLRLVRAYHPDKADPFLAKHNEEVLKLVNRAYQKMKERGR